MQKSIAVINIHYSGAVLLYEYILGDLTKQKAVRERLKCKSFDWFMKEIAFDQDKFYPAVEPEDSANGAFIFHYKIFVLLSWESFILLS